MAITDLLKYKYRHSNHGKDDGQITEITIPGSENFELYWLNPNHDQELLIDSDVHDLQPGMHSFRVVYQNGDDEDDFRVEIKENVEKVLNYETLDDNGGCSGKILVESYVCTSDCYVYTLSNDSSDFEKEGEVCNSEGGEYEFDVCAGTYTLDCIGSVIEYSYEGGELEEETLPDPYTEEIFVDYGERVIYNCEITTLIDEDIFTKNSDGVESYIDVIGDDGFDVDDCVLVTDEIIKVDDQISDCDDCRKSRYKISIKNLKDISDNDEVNDCDFTSFKLEGNGVVTFTHKNGTVNGIINKECCESLGFEHTFGDIKSKYKKCLWKELYVEDSCSNYDLITIKEYRPAFGYEKNRNSKKSNNYFNFKNIKTGDYTQKVPTAECCEVNGGEAIETNNGYLCKYVKYVK